MTYGWTRVATNAQDLGSQFAALERRPSRKVVFPVLQISSVSSA